MKYILILLIFISCNSLSKIEGNLHNRNFEWVKKGDYSFKFVCNIEFDGEYNYTYTCKVDGIITRTTGKWQIDKNNKRNIILQLKDVDIISIYPEKFYKDIDTLVLLSKDRILHKDKIFLLRNL